VAETPALHGTPAKGEFGRLLALLDPAQPVRVQTHDYPDLDALASAWGLASLLETRGLRARACYRGPIRSRSLSRLIAELDIGFDENPASGEDSQILVVDGSPANGNVSLVRGRLVGVIDHHRHDSEPPAPFIDIRPDLASCSTLILGYWTSEGRRLSRNLATALLAGLQSDTDFLSRRASLEDFAAYSELFAMGDFERASRIVRCVLDLRELDLVTAALAKAVVRDGTFFAWMPGSCGQEVLGVLADFVLRTEELRLVVIAELDGPEENPEGRWNSVAGVHLSARSKDPALSAFAVMKGALESLGSGGGHSHAAGGFVPFAAFPGPEALRERFLALPREVRANHA